MKRSEIDCDDKLCLLDDLIILHEGKLSLKISFFGFWKKNISNTFIPHFKKGLIFVSTFNNQNDKEKCLLLLEMYY